MVRFRTELAIVVSSALTLAVVLNAFYAKKQFYPSMVYLTKSNSSMAVIYLQAFVIALLLGKLMNKIFFGQLRAIEMEHLFERSWYAITETCLAFTVFRDDFSPKFVTMFTLLLFLKCFHWLAEDRVDYMERSPAITWIFHLRIVSLVSLLILFDLNFVYIAYNHTLAKGASVQLVFGFEYAILFVNVLSTLLKYSLHTIDLQSENPWENKGIFMLYGDLLLGGARVLLYVTFMTLMVKIHTFPLFAIRPMYLSLRSFKKSLNDVIMSRRAIHNLNIMYPDVTPEQLRNYSDTICIICREEMTVPAGAAGDNAAGLQIKKLPCDHIFHKGCLRSWFQRQQTCPTCRTSILRLNNHQHMPQNQAAPGVAPVPPAAAAAGQPQAAPQANGPNAQANNNFAQPQHAPQQQQPAQPFNNQLFNNLFANLPHQQGNNQAGVGAGAPTRSQGGTYVLPTPSGSGTNLLNNGVGVPSFPLFMPNISLTPFASMPPPLPPLSLSSLTLPELEAMEGNERHNVETRIHCLRNISLMLDTATLHMQQYMNICAASSHLDNLNRSRRTEPASSNTASSSLVQNDLNLLNKLNKLAEEQKAKSEAANSTETVAASNSSEQDDVAPATSNDKEFDSIRRRRLEHLQKSVSDSNNSGTTSTGNS